MHFNINCRFQGPDQPQYNPQPINTYSVNLNNDLNTITQKFSEHYHDAWASRKLENSWVHGDQWSDSQKTHPRLKPYNMLNDYVSLMFNNLTEHILIFDFQRKKKDTKIRLGKAWKLFLRLIGPLNIQNLTYLDHHVDLSGEARNR